MYTHAIDVAAGILSGCVIEASAVLVPFLCVCDCISLLKSFFLVFLLQFTELVWALEVYRLKCLV